MRRIRAMVLLVGITAPLVGCSHALPPSPAAAQRTHIEELRSALSNGSRPGAPPYPDEWKVLDPARIEAQGFSLLIPDDGPLGETAPFAAYVFPAGAVALDYDLPERPADYVRQQYIEIYEAPWMESEDPLKTWERDLQTEPNPSKSIVDVNGVPALAVEPYSKADYQRANPAFLRLVVNGVEIQLSGGDDLDLLVMIAGSLVEQSRSKIEIKTDCASALGVSQYLQRRRELVSAARKLQA